MSATSNENELKLQLRKLIPALKLALAFSWLTALLTLVPTLYMLEVYDRVVNSRSVMTLAMLTVILLVLLYLMEVLEWARSESLREAAANLDDDMAPRVFQAIYNSNVRRIGMANIQPMSDWRTLRDFAPSPWLGAAMEAPISLLFLVLLFAMHPVLGWAALVGASIQVGVAWLNERSTFPPLNEANQASFQAQRYADSSLRNAEVIKAMGMLQHIHQRWFQKQSLFLNKQAYASDQGGIYQAAAKFLQLTMSSLLLGLGAWLLLQGQLGSASGMIVASTIGARALAPLVTLIAHWKSFVQVRTAWQRLDQLLQNHPVPSPSMPLPVPQGYLSVENVVAGAPVLQGNAAPILRGIQFSLEPGDLLVVVGPSAAGKTTLARVLVGLWPALQGKVRLDGVDVASWNKTELGPHVGYVPQTVELLDGTLADNITRFGPHSPAKLQAAIDAVGLQPLVSSLPLGLQTPLGRDGAKLSGGQRQRVALARALYGEPVFIVLDEPNASLDEEGDAALSQALLQAKQRRTTLVVMTHRTSILGIADKLLVMRDGAQQLFGPRDEVITKIKEASAKAHAAKA